MLITTRIEIGSPPAVVREKFLQFNQIPKYSPNGHFKVIAPAVQNTPLEPGTKLQIELLGGMKFEPVLLENSPTAFRWLGSLPYIYTGEHRFRFLESETTKGGTTFVHEEQYSGLLSFLMGDGMVAKAVGFGEKTTRGFEGFNVDLKAWIEGGK